MALRKEVFWGTRMGDDRVIEPYFNVPYNYVDTGWGLQETNIGGEDGGSYIWNVPIESYEEDFHKLSLPAITIDHEMTATIVDLAEDILGDILTVRLRGIWWWTLGMTWDFIRLRGLNNRIRDGTLSSAYPDCAGSPPRPGPTEPGWPRYWAIAMSSR